ncbi:hypothetical protein HDZ31DRAFT_34436 [Schizophyllum fasciatum]
MPSTSLQSRISAFETISKAPTTDRPRPPVPAKPSLNGIRLSPSTLSEVPSSAAPPSVDRKTSLIDLKDWVLDDGLPSPRDTPPAQAYKVYEPRKPPTKSGVLINLESPTAATNGRAPPLPPRKPSFTSIRSVSSTSSTKPAQGAPAEHTYPPGKLDVPQKSAGHAPTSSISSFHSVSLSEDTDTTSSPSPSSSSQFIATYPVDLDRGANGSEADSASLGGESFEDVAASSYGSPTSAALIARDWDKARAMQKSAPPKLPQRPSAAASAAAAAAAAASASTPRLPSLKMPPPPPPARSSNSASPSSSSPSSPYIISPASTSSVVTAIGRRAPPPAPPSRSSTSDRSSILSTATSQTSSSTHNARGAGPSKLSLSRPTPVPPAARARYEVVFNGNVVQSRKAAQKPTLLSPSAARKTRQAAGWRGLSVDLITGEDGHPLSDNNDIQVDGTVTGDDWLDGRVVRLIWQRSRLERHKLAQIWSECDTAQRGFLDRDAFVRGMWRIDEELRRAQSRKSTLSSGSRLRPPPPPPRTKPRPILT